MALVDSIELRIAQQADFSAFWEFCSNDEVSKFLTWKKYTSIESAEIFFSEKVLKNTALPNVYLMIVYQNKVIGNAHIIERPGDGFQIGIGLLPYYWNKKIGSTVLVKLENYIRINSGVDYCLLLADVHEKNYAMKKLLFNSGYRFKCNIDYQRQAFRKIIVNKRNFDYIDWLKTNDMVEAVIGIGSLSTNEFSDIDLLVVCYEESYIEDLINQICYLENLETQERASVNHYFYSFINSRMYDIYFVSEAFLNAVNNVKRIMFDKSGLVSKVVNLNCDPDKNVLMQIAINNVSKLIYKTKEGKYDQATRVLSDIRYKTIIPFANIDNCLVSQNVIDLKWINCDSEIYKAYLSTFSTPDVVSIGNSISTILYMINYIIEKYNLKSNKEDFRRIYEYAKEFL